jgi:hypothetical protein
MIFSYEMEWDPQVIQRLIMEQADRNSALYERIKLQWCIREMEKARYRLGGDMKYFYTKACKCCGGIYYKKESSEEQFSVLEDNPNISIGCTDGEWTGEIQSCCNECAEEHYAA